MATIDQVIQREVNPFDPVTFKTGNFWQEDSQNSDGTVESIHQDAIAQITQTLDQVARDHRTRTVLLAGDVGSGKSYVLKRLKHKLNTTAFFGYIPPFPESDYIWRHALRHTVDSLMQQPAGETESQLLLWLKKLSIFENQGLMKKLLGEKGLFVNNFRSAYPSGIYQAKDFFSALYGLTQPDSYFLACDWLRGENLDQDDLNTLGVKGCIDSESAARGILANFGRIAASTLPIVLCFDQVESKLLPDGSADVQPIFQINTIFHNENLKNFLIIISIVTDTWMRNRDRIQQSDRDRVEKSVLIRQITLKQAEAIWANRLRPLHIQADSPPNSPIYPLDKQILQQKFPGGKTTPRRALTIAQHLFLKHKLGHEPPEEDVVATFKLLWQKELNKTQEKVARIRQYSSVDLVLMLRRALAALKIEEVQYKILPSPAFTSCSFSYQDSKQQNIGIIWTEEPNMSGFCRVMQACEKLTKTKLCDELYLIRAEKIGNTKNKGYSFYSQIFTQAPHQHLIPDVQSVRYLATYDRLVNSVHSMELVIGEKTLNLKDLESLIRDSEALHNCFLLQELGVVPAKGISKDSSEKLAKDFILSFIKREMLIAKQTVIDNARSQFARLKPVKIQELIQELCQEKQIRVLDEKAPEKEQVLCLVPA